MLARAVWRAMLERRQRVSLALAALTVAAALVTALLTLYSDIEGKLRQQFRGYGANLMVSPAGSRETLPLEALTEVEKHGLAAPFLYSAQAVNQELLVVAGVDFARLEALAGYWQVDGRRRPEAGECLVGARVAERFRLGPGAAVEVAGERRRVAGIVTTGSAEDSQVLLPIEELASTAGLEGQASLIAVRADGARVEQVRAALAAALPEAEVRVVRAMVEAEANVVLKIRGTLFLLTGLILLITVLCVMNNFAAIVYQRRKEIGILKAIGGSEGRIAALFAAEALAVGAAGSVAGLGLGWLLARWLGQEIFRQAVSPRPEVLPAVVAVTLAAALAATVLPLGQIRRIEPATMLRGE
jgi:putative ABC transport system permease protein